MRTKFLSPALVLISALSFSSLSQAHTWEVSQGFRLEDHRTVSVSLEHPAYVESVRIAAEGIRYAGMFEVWANGKIKGSIYVPGEDPCYIVTIREVISSLEFRSLSNSDIRVRSVVIENNSGVILNGGSLGDAVSLAQKTIELVNAVKPSANLEDLSNILMPIRKAAAHLYAAASVSSPYDTKTHSALVNLLVTINAASHYLDESLETDTNFELATGLLQVKEQLDNMLR